MKGERSIVRKTNIRHCSRYSHISTSCFWEQRTFYPKAVSSQVIKYPINVQRATWRPRKTTWRLHLSVNFDLYSQCDKSRYVQPGLAVIQRARLIWGFSWFLSDASIYYYLRVSMARKAVQVVLIHISYDTLYIPIIVWNLYDTFSVYKSKSTSNSLLSIFIINTLRKKNVILFKHIARTDECEILHH